MHILSDTGTTLTLATGSAVSTDYVVDYVDHAATSFSPLSDRGNIATATTTTILAAPAANTTRQVKSIKITNRHASDAQTVQVFVVASASSYALSENMALAAGQCVLLNDKGWTIMSDQDQVAVATGKLLTVSNTLTLAGTDGTTMTFPTTNATIARTDAAQTFSGVQTFVGRAISSDTTASTTQTTGAVTVAGGVGILGAINSGPYTITGTTATDGPTFSAELLTSSDWTTTGWTGDFATGFTHTTGNTTALTNTLAAVIGNKYQMAYTITGRTSGSVTVAFGGQSISDVTATGAFGPTATTVDSVSITPTTDFNGKIVISIKQITGGSAAVHTIKDSAGNTKTEIRSVSGNDNTANGYRALYYNTTGNSNTANGYRALYSNTTGNNNTANGYLALYSNTTGNSNTANGYLALSSNTTGTNNTANGVASLSSNTTGNSNATNGYRALNLNTTGNSNTANGSQAGYDNTTGGTNSYFGYNTGRGITTGSSNTILGANVSGLAAATTDNIVLATGQGTVRARFNGTRWNMPLSQLSAYANNAAAVSGGLASGDLYRTGGDPDLICVVH